MQARTPIDPYAAGSATVPGAGAGAARAAAPEGAPALPPRVSWGAIMAGAVVAVAIGLMLRHRSLIAGWVVKPSVQRLSGDGCPRRAMVCESAPMRDPPPLEP